MRATDLPKTLFVVAVLLLGARVTSYLMKPGARDLVRWAPLEAAARAQKPILLYFTDGSAACEMLDEQVFRNAALAGEINERLVPIRIEDRADLQQRFHVRSFPTVVFVDPNGSERARMEGFRGRAEFERVMESLR